MARDRDPNVASRDGIAASKASSLADALYDIGVSPTIAHGGGVVMVRLDAVDVDLLVAALRRRGDQ